MDPEPLVEILEWDSQFFDLRIARVSGTKVGRKDGPRINEFCQGLHIDCLYLLADPADRETVQFAEDSGFRLVDVRTTLQRDGKASEIPAGGRSKAIVRPSRRDEITGLQQIAQTSHRDSRFYWDLHFPRVLCDRLYETWIAKSCEGYADTVLVAELEGEPAGYVSCHLDDSTRGRIGLFAVSAAWRGKGVGQRLIEASIRWFRGNGVEQVSVVTQGRNRAAIRIYQKSGFQIQSLLLWYHRWFSVSSMDRAR